VIEEKMENIFIVCSTIITEMFLLQE